MSGTTLTGRLLCNVGQHDWRRSQFAALSERTANFVCTRCGRQKSGDRP